MTAAGKNGTTYITVTMKAADLAVASTDSTALFNYGYQNFTKAQVNGGEVSVPNGVTVDNLTVQENSQNGKRKNFCGDAGTAKNTSDHRSGNASSYYHSEHCTCKKGKKILWLSLHTSVPTN